MDVTGDTPPAPPPNDPPALNVPAKTPPPSRENAASLGVDPAVEKAAFLAPPHVEEENANPQFGWNRQFSMKKRKHNEYLMERHQKTDMDHIKKIHGREELLKDLKINPEVEYLLKAKLMEWDKNADGTFTLEDCRDALAELREVKLENRDKCLKFTFFIVTMLIVFVVSCGGSYAVYNGVTSQRAEKDGRLTGVAAGDAMEKNRTTVAVADAMESSGLKAMIAFSLANDNWNITDEELRHIRSTSFTDSKGKFHHMEIAHIMRFDAGKTNPSAVDKIEVLTSPGHRIRYWRGGEMQVKWYNASLAPKDRPWEFLSIGRRLHGEPEWEEDELPEGIEMPEVAYEEFDDDDVFWDSKLQRWEHMDLPPKDHRRTKGRVVIVGAATYHGSHRNNGNSHCRDIGNGRYACNSGALANATPSMWVFMMLVVALRTFLTGSKAQ